MKTSSKGIMHIAYSKEDYEKLRNILSETDWSPVSRESDVSESWAKFIDILDNAVKSCIPVCKRRSRINNQSGGIIK